MPEQIDLASIDGVGTTMADTDAAVSVVAVLFGGKANLPSETRDVLLSASYRCDHLRPHPRLSEATNEQGRGLHGHVVRRLRQDDTFSTVCRDLASTIARGEPLPHDTLDQDAQREALRALEASGRVWALGKVCVVDVRDRSRVDPEVLYERLTCPVAVVVEHHAAGGLRYTVGVNPGADPPVASIRGALERLAEAEYAYGAPAKSPHPGPGSENWGGRETVFGSPWNYGSRIGVEDVVALVAGALGG